MLRHAVSLCVLWAAVSAHGFWLEYIFYNQNKPVNIIFVHGAYGSAESLFPIARHPKIKSLANSYLISLRGHGNSPDYTRNAIKDSIYDIKDLIDRENLSNVYLVGFSLGGSVVMNFAATFGYRIKGIGVLEAIPTSLSAELLASVEDSLKALQAMDLKRPKAAIAADLLLLVKDNMWVDYLSASLEGTENNYSWTFNADVLRQFIRASTNPVPGKFYKKAVFVFGSSSFLIQGYPLEQLKAFYPRLNLAADIITVNAGHFVHVEQLEQVVDHIVKLLS